MDLRYLCLIMARPALKEILFEIPTMFISTLESVDTPMEVDLTL